MNEHVKSLMQLLQIKYPIIQAPMAGGITTANLVASVSNHGGLGNVGAGYMTSEQLEKKIRLIKEKTDNNFGVNLFVPNDFSVDHEKIQQTMMHLQPFYDELNIEPSNVALPSVEESNKRYEEQIDVIIKERVPICSFTFGLPAQSVINRLKEEEIIVIGTATTVEEAIAVEQLGLDVVVVQGMEAGGHRGTFLKTVSESKIGLMSLIPQVADLVNIPIIAAGGIMDARGIRAAFHLGAQAAQMGTAFLTTKESGAPIEHKKAIVDAKETDVVLTKSFSGKHAQGIKNKFVEHLEPFAANLPDYPVQNTLTQAIRRETRAQNNEQFMSLWSGQSPRLAAQHTVEQLMNKLIQSLN